MSNPHYGNTQKYKELTVTEKGRMRIAMPAIPQAVNRTRTFTFNSTPCLRIKYIFATPSLLAKFSELQQAGDFLTVKMRALKNYKAVNYGSCSLISQFDVPIIQATEIVQGGDN